jgi:hypothetical protein
MIPLNNQRYVASLFYDVKKLVTLTQRTPLHTHSDLMALIQKNLMPSAKSKLLPIQQEQDGKSYKGLKFNSSFESGNLFAVFRVGEREYDLVMQNDTNSKGNTQWFHFSVENTVKGQTVKFNLINFVLVCVAIGQLKNDSLFNYGQQPVCYSMRKATTKGYTWQKCGNNLQYYRNKFRKENSTSRTYYSLTFTYKFELGGDTVYFAQCYPYSYKDLLRKIECYEQDPRTRKLFTTKELCKTIGRLSVP